jgi:hypothetical protein
MSRVGSSKIRITEILGRIDLNDKIPRMSSPSSISSRATATRAVSAHRLLLVAAVPPSGRYGKSVRESGLNHTRPFCIRRTEASVGFGRVMQPGGCFNAERAADQAALAVLELPQRLTDFVVTSRARLFGR